MSIYLSRTVQVSANHPTDPAEHGMVVLEAVGLNEARVTIVGKPWAVNLDDLIRAIELVRDVARDAGYSS